MGHDDTPGLPVKVFDKSTDIKKITGDLGAQSEHVLGVHGVVCEEEWGGNKCSVYGVPRGSVRADFPKENFVEGVDAVYISEGASEEVKEHWSTLGETGIKWVERGESPYDQNLSDCIAYSESIDNDPNDDTVLVCYN